MKMTATSQLQHALQDLWPRRRCPAPRLAGPGSTPCFAQTLLARLAILSAPVALLALAALAGPAAAARPAGVECLIEPSQTVEVRTAVDGMVATVAVRRGDLVRRGQLLVELQSAAEQVAVESARFRAGMQAQIALAENRLDYARRKATRVASMVAEGFASPQALDEADSERRLAASELKAAQESQALARIDLRRAQEQLALRRLHSPFAGIVVDRLLNPGDLSEAGSGRRPVLKIAVIDTLKVDMVLPAAQFGQVKLGQRAGVTAEGDGERYAATVRQIDRAIDPASATFVVRLELPNPGHRVPVGARCSAAFDSSSM